MSPTTDRIPHPQKRTAAERVTRDPKKQAALDRLIAEAKARNAAEGGGAGGEKSGAAPATLREGNQRFDKRFHATLAAADAPAAATTAETRTPKSPPQRKRKPRTPKPARTPKPPKPKTAVMRVMPAADAKPPTAAASKPPAARPPAKPRRPRTKKAKPRGVRLTLHLTVTTAELTRAARDSGIPTRVLRRRWLDEIREQVGVVASAFTPAETAIEMLEERRATLERSRNKPTSTSTEG